MKALRVRAPAKVNLYLRVLGRRADGYHDIETLFQAIDLEDELIIQPSAGPAVLEVPGHPDLECADNLIMRAVRWIERETGRTISVKIRLNKRIPVAGGLGGGSSDAAATLAGIRALFDLPLPDESLDRGASSIGADVAFFLQGGTAIAEGIGERLTTAPVSLNHSLLLVNPGFPVSTALVYREFSKTLTEKARKGKLRTVLAEYPAWQRILHNDLQPVAKGLYPEISEIRNSLGQAGLDKVLMSGSGPTVFGLGDPEQLKEVEERISRAWNCVSARPLSRGVLID